MVKITSGVVSPEIQLLTPTTQSFIEFGDKAFKDVIKLKSDH